MVTHTPLTVRLSPQVKARLGRLARSNRKGEAALAAEAIEAYVSAQTEIMAGIASGLTDMRAGHLVPHDEAMDELDAAIDEAAADSSAEYLERR